MIDLDALTSAATEDDGWWPSAEFLHSPDRFRYEDHAVYIAALDPATVRELIRLARIGQFHENLDKGVAKHGF